MATVSCQRPNDKICRHIFIKGQIRPGGAEDAKRGRRFFHQTLTADKKSHPSGGGFFIHRIRIPLS